MLIKLSENSLCLFYREKMKFPMFWENFIKRTANHVICKMDCQKNLEQVKHRLKKIFAK